MFIAPGTVGAYFTLTLRSLGYSTIQTNLLSIPSSVLTIIFNLSLAYTANKRNERILTASVGSWWLLIMFIALINLPDTTSKWAKWAVLTLIVGYPVRHINEMAD
jgi:hypothetical protein